MRISFVVAPILSFVLISTTIPAEAYTFPNNLQLGAQGEDVKQLQIILNQDPTTQVATTGPGAPGNETTYFGPATKAAVIKFQNKYASEVLYPAGLYTGSGYFGPLSRAKINNLKVTNSSTTETTQSQIQTTPTVSVDQTKSIESTYSDTLGATQKVTTSGKSQQNLDTTAPTVPTNVILNEKTSNSVRLSWTASNDPIVSNKLTSGVAYYLVKYNSISTTVYTNSAYIINLKPETTYSFTVTAVDKEGNKSKASSALTVTTDKEPVTNVPPSINGVPATTTIIGNLYNFTPVASDQNGDTLTFSITNKPSWATFDTKTGKLTGTPTATGTFSNITIFVTDGKMGSLSLPTFSITVVDKTATAKLLFKSNFGKGVTISEPYNITEKGAWQRITGLDSETGYSWPTSIVDTYFSGIQWITYSSTTPETIKEHISTEIRPVVGPEGNTVNELAIKVLKKAPVGTGVAQAPFLLSRAWDKGDVNDFYVSFWFKNQSNLLTQLDSTVSAGNWRAFYEIKTGGHENTWRGDYRITTHIMKDKDGRLFWYTKGDNVANGPWPRIDYWVEKNYDVPVPVDKWFKYEAYWHRSSGSDGRWWAAVDGQVIVDHKGPNMGDYNLPINRIFITNPYSGGYAPVESHLTGLEIWNGFPCGVGVSCYKK